MISIIGNHFYRHYKRRQKDSGTLTVAKQMRKQGVPIEIAVLILANNTK